MWLRQQAPGGTMINSGPEGFQRYREGQSESVAGLCQVIEDIL